MNELDERDTDDNGTTNFTLTYTAAGHLADDAQHDEYSPPAKGDAWGRLVTAAAFEYNGLGHRIGHQWDKDADTDPDQQWLVHELRKPRVVLVLGQCEHPRLRVKSGLSPTGHAGRPVDATKPRTSEM